MRKEGGGILKNLTEILGMVTKTVMAVSACVVFVVTFLQVICRYVLKAPLPWSTDVVRLAFVYLVFWGAAWCVKEKGNLSVDFLLSVLPEKTRKICDIVINLISLGFFAFLIYFGVIFVETGQTQTTSYLPISMSIYYLSIPGAGVLMVIFMLQILAEQMKELGGKGGKT